MPLGVGADLRTTGCPAKFVSQNRSVHNRRVWSFFMVAVTLSVALAGLPARATGPVEKVTIPTPGGRVQLAGYWFAAAASSPRPAVVSLHGCNGALDDKGALNPVWRRDAGYFNDEAMHFLVLDSFTPRGIGSICETLPSARRVDESDRRDDVYAAIRWLAARPDVDSTRIAVVGRLVPQNSLQAETSCSSTLT